MVRRLWVSLGLLAFIGVSFTASTISVSPAHAAENDVIDTVTVGIDPFGVAVSPDGTRVYVANSGTTTVSVIDTTTNPHTVSAVTVGTNPRGVAVSPDGTRVYVTNHLDGNVSVIDTTATPNTVTSVTVGTNPFGVAVSPDGTRVYVANTGGVGTVSVINTSTNSVTGVTLGSAPAGVAVSPDGTRVYVTNNGGVGTVSVINTSTNTVAATVTVGSGPIGVAVSPDGTRVYVANVVPNNVSVIEGISTPSASPTDSGAPAPVKPPTLADTGPDLSLVLVGSGVSALLLFVGAAAILASRRKLTGS